MNPANFQAIYVLWLRQIKRFIRTKSRLIANFVQPFFFLIALGFGFSFVRFEGGLNYLDFLTPGIISMSVIFSSMFAGVSVIWDKQFGFLKEVLVAPVSRLTIVVGQTFGGSTLAIFQGLVILLISMLLGVKINLFGIVPAVLFMIMIAFLAVSFGLIIASKLDDFQGFQLIMNLLILPLIFLSGAFFPIESAPEWMRIVMFGNPITYAVDGLRGFLVGSFTLPIYIDVFVVSITSITLMLIGSYAFNRYECV